MKAGRPVNRRKARWIVFDVTEKTQQYYKLDDKGNLTLQNGQAVVDHEVTKLDTDNLNGYVMDSFDWIFCANAESKEENNQSDFDSIFNFEFQ